MQTCPTVTIKTVNGPVDINEADFDEATMELWTPARKKVTKKTTARKPKAKSG